MYKVSIGGHDHEVRNISDLLALSLVELAVLYNGLTKRKVKGFSSKKNGADAIWKELQKRSVTKGPKSTAAQPDKPRATQKTPKVKDEGEFLGGAAIPVKHTTAKMLRRIKKIKEHPGKGLRIKRWHLYKDGMTLKQVQETAGIQVVEVMFYVTKGLMKLEKPIEQPKAD